MKLNIFHKKKKKRKNNFFVRFCSRSLYYLFAEETVQKAPAKYVICKDYF